MKRLKWSILSAGLITIPFVLGGCVGAGEDSFLDKYTRPFTENWWGWPLFAASLIVLWVIYCLVKGRSIKPWE